MLAAALLTLSTIAAPEADQGVASDRSHVYAIDNYAIGKYDKASGKRVAGWEGDPKLFPHLNSCAVVKAELVCAASNYPKVRSEEHTSELQSLMRISYAVFCLKKKTKKQNIYTQRRQQLNQVI